MAGTGADIFLAAVFTLVIIVVIYYKMFSLTGWNLIRTTMKILATGPIDDVAIDILRPFGDVLVAPDAGEESLLSLVDGAIGLVARGSGRISARVIHAGKNLKVIGRSGVGYESVDIAAATERKIPVVYTPGASSRAVAEAAMALMLGLCKNLSYWDAQLKTGNWQSRLESRPGDLDGATLGMVGFGNIAQVLTAMARPFRMSVLAYDPYAAPDRAGELGVTLVKLDELLQRSDFISLHAPLTAETKGLINKQNLSLVKPGAFLINLARGGLIESLDVLYDAMQNGWLAGVGLDVFEPEPPDVSHPIFKLPNCVASPHSLGTSERAMNNIFRSMASDMAAVLQGHRPRFVVNPQVFS